MLDQPASFAAGALPIQTRGIVGPPHRTLRPHCLVISSPMWTMISHSIGERSAPRREC